MKFKFAVLISFLLYFLLFFSLSFLKAQNSFFSHHEIKAKILAIKKSKKYEQGEPIAFILKIKNPSNDTVRILEPLLAGGGGKWRIKKGLTLQHSGMSVRFFDGVPSLTLNPNEEKTFKIDPTNLYTMKDGRYSIRVYLQNEKGKVVAKSNSVKIRIIPFNAAQKDILDALNKVRFCKSGETKINRTKAFLEKYPDSHFSDELILAASSDLYREKRFDEGIKLLSKFDDENFKTSDWQRNKAYHKIARDYKELGEKEKAIYYLQRISNRTYHIEQEIQKIQNMQ